MFQELQSGSVLCEASNYGDEQTSRFCKNLYDRYGKRQFDLVECKRQCDLVEECQAISVARVSSSERERERARGASLCYLCSTTSTMNIEDNDWCTYIKAGAFLHGASWPNTDLNVEGK